MQSILEEIIKPVFTFDSVKGIHKMLSENAFNSIDTKWEVTAKFLFPPICPMGFSFQLGFYRV